ncbi:MAG TPA: beta-N-acetylhexosaminidase [Galbitalea sp.]|nr:beta-N-acetylhexosaminidase [Galbitalea sp.]
MNNSLRENASAVLLPGFTGPALPTWLAARLRDGLGGVCLFSTNIQSMAQLSELTSAIREANPLALIAIDEEGGDVTRLHSDTGSPFPGNALLGRIDDLELTRSVATTVGWELRRVGVNLNFAPDIDINSNANNPVIGIRSFGADAELVARHSAAWVEGLQVTGVAASVKHFPGHGDTATDSHLALPVVDRSLEELRRRELMPFVAAIAAGTKTVMTSHILLPRVDPENPATLSREILHEVLRDELGFSGVIVSDALDMKGASGETGIPIAAVRAVGAGVDLLCIGTHNTDDQLAEIESAIVAAVERDTLAAGRLADAASRNRTLARELLAFERELPTSAALAGANSTEVGNSREREELSAAFDVQPAVRVSRNRIIATLETAPNIAVAGSPWGLQAAGVPVTQLREGDTPPAGEQLVLVGKDNHRHAWVREMVDSARRRHPSTLVIDMGWPSEDRRYADIATFGASRVVGRTLAEWLERVQR